MIAVPEITIERIAVTEGHGESLRDLSLKVAREVVSDTEDVGGVIVATFSNERRFPALAVEMVSSLGLSSSIPAFDIQLACSAYPYAVYLAGRIAADTGKKVLVIDGDVQNRLVDASDHDTGSIFSDAVTASLVSSGRMPSDLTSLPCSFFDFLNKFNDSALSCSESGPIKMKGFDVFSFVATDVSEFLKEFLSSLDNSSFLTSRSSLLFVPHQANPYMIRQLAKSLDLADRLLTLDEAKKNPGSCSIPMTLAAHPECRGKRVLLAGFGAGYSASVAVVKIA